METPEFYAFVVGFLTAAYLAAAVFFLKFWRRTRDGLFVAFAVAFLLLALAAPLPLLLDIPSERQAPVYLLRLAAFLLIIGAILRKNLQGPRR